MIVYIFFALLLALICCASIQASQFDSERSGKNIRISLCNIWCWLLRYSQRGRSWSNTISRNYLPGRFEMEAGPYILVLIPATKLNIPLAVNYGGTAETISLWNKDSIITSGSKSWIVKNHTWRIDQQETNTLNLSNLL